ncbi:hypothetical protein B296_00033275 [Ensete ventricosum]|uniref:Uncharacterized protein n=1 Tax=Ensete ventricosum TaxID=4639 RepID=A0A426X5Y6_ENSVE|nr:hypothetical protein B296_00033275 [Ensete ventricosum]
MPPSPLPLRGRKRCTPSAWTAATALGWHHAGQQCHLAQALPLLAVTPANDHSCRRKPWLRGYPLWPVRGRCLCPQAPTVCESHARGWPRLLAGGRATGGYPCKGLWPWPATPVGGLTMAGRPTRGLALARHPFPRCVCRKNAARICISPLCLHYATVVAAPARAKALHAVGMDNRHCPRAAPRGSVVPPYAVLPLLAVTAANDHSCRRKPWLRGCPLWPVRGRCLCPQAPPCRQEPCPRVATTTGDCPCKGLWPWPTTPIGGLTMGSWPWPHTPFLIAFAVKIQQERVERFHAIQSHHTQFKTNLLHENLGSDTTVGKSQRDHHMHNRN